MSLQEIMDSDKVMLVPTDIAEILSCKPYSINVQAKQNPAALGFPVAVIGTRVKIPRVAFLEWLSGAGIGKEQSND